MTRHGTFVLDMAAKLLRGWDPEQRENVVRLTAPDGFVAAFYHLTEAAATESLAEASKLAQQYGS